MIDGETGTYVERKAPGYSDLQGRVRSYLPVNITGYRPGI
jgi:hypothetical protein